VEPYKVTVTLAIEDVRCDRCAGIIRQGEYQKVIQEKPNFHPRLKFVHSDKQGNEICPTQKTKESEQSYHSRRIGIKE